MQGITLTRERKIILVIGVILLLFGAVYRFGPSFGDLLPSGEEVSVKARRLAKYRQKVAEREQLHQQVVDLTRRLERARGELLSGATPALAAVEIQNIINEIVFADQIEIVSLSTLKPAESDIAGYLEVPVQVNLKLTIRQLLDLLYKLESAPQLLAVSMLNVRKTAVSGPGQLQALLTVTGYMKNG